VISHAFMQFAYKLHAEHLSVMVSTSSQRHKLHANHTAHLYFHVSALACHLETGRLCQSSPASQDLQLHQTPIQFSWTMLTTAFAPPSTRTSLLSRQKLERSMACVLHCVNVRYVACMKWHINKHTSCTYLGLITKQLKRDRIGNLERQSIEGKCCLVKLKVHPHVLHAHPRQVRSEMRHCDIYACYWQHI